MLNIEYWDLSLPTSSTYGHSTHSCGIVFVYACTQVLACSVECGSKSCSVHGGHVSSDRVPIHPFPEPQPGGLGNFGFGNHV